MQSTYRPELAKMLAKAGVSLVDVKRDQIPVAKIEKRQKWYTVTAAEFSDAHIHLEIDFSATQKM